MRPKPSTSWRLWLGVVGIVLGIAGVTYASICPKGFVRFSGHPATGSFSCIDHAGITTPEHYLSLKDGGRIGFFGGPLAGEGGHVVLMRTGGAAGKWLCGTSTSTRFSFVDGEAQVKEVRTILDEAKSPRTGNMTLSGLGGGIFGDGCKMTRVEVTGNVLQVAVDPTSAGGGANQELTRLDLTMSGSGINIVTQVDLAAPWTDRGDVEREVTYAWVRLTEVVDGRDVRRIAVAGAGSRLERKQGCATLILEGVTPLAACPGEGDKTRGLDISW